MKFEDVLREHRVPIAPDNHEHVRPGWLQFDCPFCDRRGHYRMGYNQRNRYVNCWQCGPHSLAETLVHLCDITWREAKAVVGDLERGPIVTEKKERGKLKLPSQCGELLPAHRKYLKRRGYDPDELVALWKLMGTGPLSGKLSWRVVAPIIYHGETVSWTSRKLNDKGLRWRSAAADEEIFNHKELLYGIDYVRHAAIVNEGPTDVWAVGPGAVGTCGTGFSQAQVAALARLPRRIVCFDSSPEAQVRARELCDALEPFPGETMNVVLDADDPGSAKAREIRALRRLLRG